MQYSDISERKIRQADVAVINKEYAKNIITTALAADTFEAMHRYLLNSLKSLDKAQIDQLTLLIKADMNSGSGEILPLNYIMPWRVAEWICNYSDDHLERLQYDLALDGDIGPIDSVSTVQYYKFKPENEKEIIISIGMTTLQKYNNAIVAGHDWECLPNRARLLLRRDTGNGPDHYIALKISVLPNKSNPVVFWPECN